MKNNKIDWTKSDQEVVTFINTALTAYTLLDNEKWYIGKARVLFPDETFVMVMKIFFPGEVINIDEEGIYVQAGTGMIKILALQPPGQEMVSASTFYLSEQRLGLGSWFDRDAFEKTMK
ncbi:methionyl-tRNA formyltransferase [Spiroplasma sp. SV19]|uniref:methionyl-tRNA formyltransferase n=1 Tax=Spiroplasma sp. SV19 TaxID=2570468 RepID=UPI0024B691F5|nr:methionyl-tRNA formyltransferase [Spiroplasma sp. SV19]